MVESISPIQPPKRGFLQFFILKLIYEKPRYGYEILNECITNIKEETCTKSGTIYTILHRLEKSGLVKSEWKKESDQTPNVRIYEITAEGKTALIAGLETLAKRKPVFDQLICFYDQIVEGKSQKNR